MATQALTGVEAPIDDGNIDGDFLAGCAAVIDLPRGLFVLDIEALAEPEAAGDGAAPPLLYVSDKAGRAPGALSLWAERSLAASPKELWFPADAGGLIIVKADGPGQLLVALFGASAQPPRIPRMALRRLDQPSDRAEASWTGAAVVDREPPPRRAGRSDREPAALIRRSGILAEAYYAEQLRALSVEPPADPVRHYVEQGWRLGVAPSPLFDGEFYLSQVAAAAPGGRDPLTHYLQNERHSGNRPHPLFDPVYYRERYPDAAELGPLAHYAQRGGRQGYKPCAVFDGVFYLSRHAHEISAGETPLAHYLRVGMASDLMPNPLFDPRYYRKYHPETASSGLSPLLHYLRIGEARGYKPHAYFDPAFYVAQYPDARRAEAGALAHFLDRGWAQRRQPNPLFDPEFYTNVHADIAASATDPLEHYLHFGAREGRQPHADFSPGYYRENSSDLDDDIDLLAHFLDHGSVEGRWPNSGFNLPEYNKQHPELLARGISPFFHFITGGKLATARVPDKREFLFLPWRADVNAVENEAVAKEGPERLPTGGYFKVLLVSHAANRTGAPLILLELARELRSVEGIECWILVHEEGELLEEFSKAAPTLLLREAVRGGEAPDDAISRVARWFRGYAPRGVAVTNTAAVAAYTAAFASEKVPVLAWIHELPTSIDTHLGGKKTFDKIAASARLILCPSDFVKRALAECYDITPGKLVGMHYGVAPPAADLSRKAVRAAVTAELGIRDDCRIVLGCGTGDLRKGVDLFLQLAARVVAMSPVTEDGKPIFFVWVGDLYDAGLRSWLEHDRMHLGLRDVVFFTGRRSDPEPFFAAADVFALTSREDPFPMVNLEALSHGLPVVAFADGGGAPEVLSDKRGYAVPYLDVDAMARRVMELLAMGAWGATERRRNRDYIRAHHTWDQFRARFVDLLRRHFGYRDPRKVRVSAIVPNFNYARFLHRRLTSIVGQTHQPDEIIFIDNASTDDSVAIARLFANKAAIPFKILVNDKNNGSTFKQWLRGFAEASHELVWIAESDDFCDQHFLERLLPEFYDENVFLAYSQSAVVGANGELYAPNYLEYTDELSTTHWESYYSIAGEEEIKLALSQKNTIPNASAVVFRRPEVEKIEENLVQQRLAGDWWFYVYRGIGGRISFIPQPLNFHRRHGQTVTHKLEREDSSFIEALTVKRWLINSVDLPMNVKLRSLAATVAQYHIRDIAHRDILDHPRLAGPLKGFLPLLGIDEDAGEMRLLIVLPDVEVGGGQITSIRLANALAKKHVVFVCNARPRRFDAGVAALLDPNVLLLEGTLAVTEWAEADGDRENRHQLAEGSVRLKVVRDLIRAHRISVILSNVWWGDRFAYKVVSSTPGLRWFIRMHGCYEGNLETPDWDPEFDELAQRMLRACQGVLYCTRRNLSIFEEKNLPYPPICLQLFNGFDPAEVPPARKRQPAKDVFVFCLCSRAIAEKGWREAILAVQAINRLPPAKRANKHARLVLVGDGPFALELKQEFGDDPAIDFRGYVQRVTEVIVEADAGLLPSRFVSESVPSTIVEYLACGLPVIATDLGSIPEMISVEGTAAGLVLSLNGRLTIDPDALALLMLKYMSDRALYDRHRKNARQLFHRLFDINVIARKYAENFVDRGEPEMDVDSLIDRRALAELE
jgi:glycosyltransferase involved in cell wall biosynthesis